MSKTQRHNGACNAADAVRPLMTGGYLGSAGTSRDIDTDIPHPPPQR